MIRRGDEPLSRRGAPGLEALRDAFLEDVGLHGAPDGARVVGHYLLLERIGQGASGTVWRALHRELLHEVAIKLFEPGPAGAPDRVERFRREAATAARLRHPGIVTVHDFGSDGGSHYLAMELVEGQPFDRWLAEEEPDLDRRLAIVEAVARAAQHAHEAGIVHRDLKPANVVVRAHDVPVIVDFGVARARDDDHLTREGAVVGTVAFMAPEQLRGERDVDARADVWALGMLLHFAATRTLPDPPTHVDPTLPRALDVLVRRCLEADPALRLQSAGALADDLARLRRGEPILAGATTAARRLWRRIRSRPKTAAFALAAAVVVAFGVLLFEETRGSLDQKSRILQVETALLELTPRLRPLLARAEESRSAPRSAAATDALLAEIDSVLESGADATGVRDAWRAWSLFLLRPELAEAAFATAKSRHPENPFVWLLSGRRELRRGGEVPGWAPGQPVTYELLVEPATATATLHNDPATRAEVASAREDFERARAILVAAGVPGLEWALRLCEGFERFSAGDAKGVIERLTPLARYDEIDLEATLLLCLALCQERRVPDAVEQARRLRDAHPASAPAARLLALCLQVDARDHIARGESPTSELEEAQRAFAGASGGTLIGDVLAAQVDYDLETAHLLAGGSTREAWRSIVARWEELRDRTLASGADARARGAAHARVGGARNNLALFDMPRFTALAGLRAAAADFRTAADLAGDSPWIGAQLVEARVLVQELLARHALPLEADELDAARRDAALLREISSKRKSEWGVAHADLGEAQVEFCAALASGDDDDAARADRFERAAALAHQAGARWPELGVWINVELECELHALLLRAAPIEKLRAWESRLADESLASTGELDARWIRPPLTAALDRERGDRVELARFGAALARRCAQLLPDDARCETLVVESELALRFVDAGGAGEHAGAALDHVDAFLARHAADGEATIARALALAALADAGGRDGLAEEECLEALREAIAPKTGDGGDARALLLDLWLARRDGDDERAGQVAERLSARLAADPDGRLDVEAVVPPREVARCVAGAPQAVVDAAKEWVAVRRAIADAGGGGAPIGR